MGLSLVQSQQAISVWNFHRFDEIPVSEEYLLDRAYLELMQAGLDQAATKRTLARNLRMVLQNLTRNRDTLLYYHETMKWLSEITTKITSVKHRG